MNADMLSAGNVQCDQEPADSSAPGKRWESVDVFPFPGWRSGTEEPKLEDRPAGPARQSQERKYQRHSVHIERASWCQSL